MIRNLIRLMEIFSLIYTIAAVYGQKVKCNIYVVVFMMTELVLLSGINEYGLAPYLFTLSYVLLFLYGLLNYRSTVKETIVSCVMAYLVAGMFQLISYVLVSFALEIVRVDVLQKEFLITIVNLVAICLVVNKMHLNDLRNAFLKNNKLLSAVGIFALIVLGSQIVEIKKNGILDAKLTISIVYFVLLLVVLIYEWEKERKETEKRKTQLELNKLYYDAYESLIVSMREKQHDFRNHLNAIEGMLYSIDDYQQLVIQQKDYLRKITGNIENMRLLTLVENPIIAGFLNYQISKAFGMGIEVEYDCILSKREMKIPEFEIVEMMGILLDNSIEAVTQENVQKYIEIKLYEMGEYLVFSVGNPYREDDKENISCFFDAGYSNKGKNRGIGLSKLKHMIDKNKGEIRVSEVNSLHIGFELKIEIYIKI